MHYRRQILPSAKLEVDPTDMPLLLRWYPRPGLAFLAVVALVPTALLWGAALADALGLTHLLNALPVPATASIRSERLLLLTMFLAVMLLFPLIAALSGFLATIAFELQVANWEISARLRLPAPPWSKSQLLAVALLALGALLFMAMAGHLAADCVFGNDCGLP